MTEPDYAEELTTREEPLTGQGSLLEQRAQRRVWQAAEDAAAVIRQGAIGTARELLTEALHHLDTMEQRRGGRTP